MKNGVTIHVDSRINENNCRTMIFREKGMTPDGRLLDRTYKVELEKDRVQSLKAYSGEKYMGGYERINGCLWADQPTDLAAVVYDAAWEVGAEKKQQITSDLDYFFLIRMKTNETSKNPFDWKAGFYFNSSDHQISVMAYDGSKAEFSIVPNGLLCNSPMLLVINDNVERVAKEDQKKLNALDVLARLAALDQDKQQEVLLSLSNILAGKTNG